MGNFKMLSAVFSFLVVASASPAAVLNLGSYTKTTDGDQSFSTVFNGGAQLFNFTSGTVYVALEVTFTNPATPGTLDVTASFGGYSHSAGDVFGQLWQQSTIGVNYYGERSTGVAITPGLAISLVVKYELNGPGIDGDTVKFWVNPVLGTGTESAPNDADAGRLWGPGAITSDDMRFRRGNSSENQIAFSNVRVYSAGDSPFAAVPEPSAAALLAGLAMSGLLRRRRAGV